MAASEIDLKLLMLDAFKRHDRDGKGSISRGRLRRVLASLGLGHLKEGDIDLVVSAAEDHDGKIQYEELVDWITSPTTGTPAGLSRCSTGIESGDKTQAREDMLAQDLEARSSLENYCSSLRCTLHEVAPTMCPKGHALGRFFTNHQQFLCDGCQIAQAHGDVMLGCRQCDYDLCARCAELEKVDRLEGAVLDALGWLDRNSLADKEEVEAKHRELKTLGHSLLTAIERPLSAYFQRSYFEGELFEGPRYRRLFDDELQLPVLEHVETGIRVWAGALDLRQDAPLEPFLVLYFYTSRAGIGRIVKDGTDRAAAFTYVNDVHTHFGAGIYASYKEPQMFRSKEAVLLNNFWPRVGDAEVADPRHATHLLAMGNPDAGPEDPRNRPVCEAILRDDNRKHLADYCVAMIVPERFAFNIWARTPPDLAGWCTGCNRWGEKQWADRDIWVVQLAIPPALDCKDSEVEVGRKRVAYLNRTKGPHHPDTLACVSELAWMLKGIGEYAEAEPLFRHDLRASEELLGPTHPDTLTSVDNLAGLLKAMGIFDEAETLYRRALEGSKRKLGSAHPDTLTSINNLAGLLKATGNFDEAESLYRRALSGSQEALGPTHPDTLTSMSNLAALLKARGNLADAAKLYRIILKAREDLLGPLDRQTLRSLTSLGSVTGEMGGEVEAEHLLRRAYRGAHDSLGTSHPETTLAFTTLMGLLERLGRHEEVAQLRAHHGGS